jgi:hypothetical protein
LNHSGNITPRSAHQLAAQSTAGVCYSWSMDDDQLDELEMHIAAGTDVPTAMAAVERDEPPQQGGTVSVVIGFVVALLFVLGWLWLK